MYNNDQHEIQFIIERHDCKMFDYNTLYNLDEIISIENCLEYQILIMYVKSLSINTLREEIRNLRVSERGSSSTL